MRSVLENLGNSAKKSLDPAEMSVNRAFCSSVSREGQIGFQLGHHIEGGETRVGFGQIKFHLVFSVFVYKILLAVTAFDYVLVFYIFVSNDLFLVIVYGLEPAIKCAGAGMYLHPIAGSWL